MRIDLHDEVFNDVYIQYLNNLARTQIYYGGSGSGKSVFLSQRTIIDLLLGGRNYLVCRQVANTVRKSVFNEINKVISDWNIKHLFQINKTDGVITCKANGYQIIFIGLDDTEKVKSITPAKGVITDIWIEEATEIEEKSLKELYKRQRGGSDDVKKRMVLSFNPILQSHFIYTSFFAPVGWADDQTEYTSDELTILKTWYIHNRFLTPDDVKDLTTETDSYYYNVYTLGNWGILGNVIFTNYSVQDLSGMVDQFVNLRCGGDFGFSSDPAALVKSHYDRKHKRIYIFDERYERGLTNDMLAGEIKAIFENHYSIFDSSEPKSIEELKRYGCNVLGAKKGKDSVIHGIQWLQQQEIIIDKSCVNTINEFQQYKWKEDKDGNAIRQPVDKNNHIIDALRYAYEADAEESWLMV